MLITDIIAVLAVLVLAAVVRRERRLLARDLEEICRK